MHITAEQYAKMAASYETEARNRASDPSFAAWLQSLADKCRQQATPAQGDLFA